MRHFIASLAVLAELFIYGFITTVIFEMKNFGGVLPFGVLLLVMGATWQALTKKPSKKLSSDSKQPPQADSPPSSEEFQVIESSQNPDPKLDREDHSLPRQESGSPMTSTNQPETNNQATTSKSDPKSNKIVFALLWTVFGFLIGAVTIWIATQSNNPIDAALRTETIFNIEITFPRGSKPAKGIAKHTGQLQEVGAGCYGVANMEQYFASRLGRLPEKPVPPSQSLIWQCMTEEDRTGDLYGVSVEAIKLSRGDLELSRKNKGLPIFLVDRNLLLDFDTVRKVPLGPLDAYSIEKCSNDGDINAHGLIFHYPQQSAVTSTVEYRLWMNFNVSCRHLPDNLRNQSKDFFNSVILK